MTRYHLLTIGFLLAIAGGCDCRGCSPVTIGPSDAGDGGDGGYLPYDGGDGFAHGGTPDGGLQIDGGNGVGQNVQLGPDGGIQLIQGMTSYHYAWIANDSNGWVSKYDTLTGREIGRYWTVLPNPAANLFAYIPDAGGIVYSSNHPSRTALDLNGDVWVANRALGCEPGTGEGEPVSGCVGSYSLYGSITKILSDPAQCVPRNGTPQTSRDLNDSGVIGDAPGEFIIPPDPADANGYDDCVVFTVPLGTNPPGNNRKARGLAVALGGTAGEVWAGMHLDKRVYRIDSATGQVLPANADGGMWIDLPWGPYGLAVDSRQRLWIAGAPGDHTSTVIALVDTATRQLVDGNITPPAGFDPSSMYGIAVDGKDRVWLGGWMGGPYVYRYDRSLANDGGVSPWSRFYVGDQTSQTGSLIGRTRGITVDVDGTVYASSDTYPQPDGGPNGAAASQLIALNSDTGAVRPFVNDAGVSHAFLDFTPSGASTAIGVGLDFNGGVWVNNYSTTNIVHVKKDTGDFTVLPSQAPLSGQAPGHLYTYSDFTGYQLINFTSDGTYQYTLKGCGTNTVWDHITWKGTTTPGQSEIDLYVAASNDLSAFGTAQQFGPFSSSPAELQDGGVSVPQALYLRLTFKLRTLDHISTPTLYSFDGAWYCSGPPG